MNEVRAVATEIAITAAAQLISENLDKPQAETLINDAISSLQNRLE